MQWKRDSGVELAILIGNKTAVQAEMYRIGAPRVVDQREGHVKFGTESVRIVYTGVERLGIMLRNWPWLGVNGRCLSVAYKYPGPGLERQ